MSTTDLNQRIINEAIKFKNASLKVGARMKELQSDPKRLKVYMENSVVRNQQQLQELFSLLDEYEAINGEVKPNL